MTLLTLLLIIVIAVLAFKMLNHDCHMYPPTSYGDVCKCECHAPNSHGMCNICQIADPVGRFY